MTSMRAHRFKAGQHVRVVRGSHIVPAGTYEIVRPLPLESASPQYRVRSVGDGRERVVDEADLTR